MRFIRLMSIVVLVLLVANITHANDDALSGSYVESWLKSFESAVKSKNTNAVATMLSDNFDYELSSTEKGVTASHSKDTFLAGIAQRDSLIEWNKDLDIHVQGKGALIVQSREVKVNNDTMTLTTSLIDYFYLGEENGNTVLLRIQTEEQSDKTKVTFAQ